MNKPQEKEFKFNVGANIKDVVDVGIVYHINDIIYSKAFNMWYYEYSYWFNGYEHYCKMGVSEAHKKFELQ